MPCLSQNEEANKFNDSLVTGVLFWGGLVVISSLYATIPLLPLLEKQFKATPIQVAWAGTAFALFYAFGCLISGPLSDYFGRKNVIVFGLSGVTLITGLIGFSYSLWLLVALRGLQGFVAATYAPVVLTYVVDMFRAEKRVTALGFISSGFLMAGIIGQMISGLISYYYSWASVFFVFSGIYLLTALFIKWIIPSDQKRKDLRFMEAFKQYGAIIHHKTLWLCFAITKTLLFTFVGMYSILGHYLSTKFQLGDQEIFYVRAVGIIGMVIAPFAGMLVHRFGYQMVLRVGILFALVGLTFLSVGSHFYFLIAMTVIYVSGISLTVPTLISFVGQLAGEASGAAVSLYSFILFVGASLGPIYAATILKTNNFLLAFGCLALLMATSLFISFMIKPVQAELGMK